MEELKPCPFCGGEASVIGKPHETKFCVGCGDDTCLGFSGLGWLYGTEEDAAAAWNRRAERTCRMKPSDIADYCSVHAFAGGTEFVRTFGYRMCSECETYVFDCPTVSYCPSCGAKVVE